MNMLTWKQSQKVLAELAAISTQDHAKQVIKRNTEALNSEYGSKVPCPHCDFDIEKYPHYQCENCLWTAAIKEVCSIDLWSVGAPCMLVRFGSSLSIPNPRKNVYLKIVISHDNLSFRFLAFMRIYAKRWMNAHIKWARNVKAWGTKQPPEGYRVSVKV